MNCFLRPLLITAALALFFVPALADTPKLHIRLKNGTPIEERKKEQMERLAKQYDLKKWTITRDILIEQGVRPHSSPVLTLNGRWPDEDDLALSMYLHEQAHWVLIERHQKSIGTLRERTEYKDGTIYFDVTDPTFSQPNVLLDWGVTSGPYGSVVDRITSDVTSIRTSVW